MCTDLPAFYQALSANPYSATLYVDHEGRIRFWNKAAERIFGYSMAEAVGQLVDIIVPEHLRDRHWKGFHGRISTKWGGPRKWATLPARHRDGAIITLDTMILPVHDGEENVAGIAAFFCQPLE